MQLFESCFYFHRLVFILCIHVDYSSFKKKKSSIWEHNCPKNKCCPSNRVFECLVEKTIFLNIFWAKLNLTQTVVAQNLNGRKTSLYFSVGAPTTFFAQIVSLSKVSKVVASTENRTFDAIICLTILICKCELMNLGTQNAAYKSITET